MLAWMDLEMTGLEPERHVIIEIATILTDDHLNIVAEGPDLVVHATDDQLAEMGEFVTEMHTKSGVLEAVRRAGMCPVGLSSGSAAAVRSSSSLTGTWSLGTQSGHRMASGSFLPPIHFFHSTSIR